MVKIYTTFWAGQNMPTESTAQTYQYLSRLPVVPYFHSDNTRKFNQLDFGVENIRVETLEKHSIFEISAIFGLVTKHLTSLVSFFTFTAYKYSKVLFY